MIHVGIDLHSRNMTLAAVNNNGELIGQITQVQYKNSTTRSNEEVVSPCAKEDPGVRTGLIGTWIVGLIQDLGSYVRMQLPSAEWTPYRQARKDV